MFLSIIAVKQTLGEQKNTLARTTRQVVDQSRLPRTGRTAAAPAAEAEPRS